MMDHKWLLVFAMQSTMDVPVIISYVSVDVEQVPFNGNAMEMSTKVLFIDPLSDNIKFSISSMEQP